MIKLFTNEYRVTQTELRFRGYEVNEAKLIMDKLCNLSNVSSRFKLMHDGYIKGIIREEIQWVRGVCIYSSIKAITSYINKNNHRRNTNIPKWSKLLLVLNTIKNDLENNKIQRVLNENNQTTAFIINI